MTVKRRKHARLGMRLLFYIYIVILFYFVLLSERYGRGTGYATARTNFVLFKEIHRFIQYRSQMTLEAFCTNMIGNVFAFTPFGFLVPVMTEKKRGIIRVVALTFLLSFMIESCQYIFKVGVFDVDDLLLNTIGGLIGYLIYKIVITVYRRRSRHAKK